jgi:hypothetical protein
MLREFQLDSTTLHSKSFCLINVMRSSFFSPKTPCLFLLNMAAICEKYIKTMQVVANKLKLAYVSKLFGIVFNSGNVEETSSHRNLDFTRLRDIGDEFSYV